ncbi:MAG: thioredoxin domain-containing protein [Pirellulales bacterium]
MNALATETSPYLLQHQNNPVEWYPWGPEALSRAKREDKAIFLSIGYSACHWCHVMEHESFEDQRIASLMNEHFVNIKVDREERPDLDAIYMNAVQIMTGRGGWPMSVFLTPDLKPFYGGTYFPPTQRMGMPGFDQILLAVADAWKNRREQALQQAAELTQHLQQAAAPAGAGEAGELTEKLLFDAATALERGFDPRHGGFGEAPKFPHPMDLRLLMRVWSRTGRAGGTRAHHDAFLRVVTHTLDKMAAGGIYDQLGGGFHRYSVDERWLVPHFEKMLYDNALLIGAYVDAYLVTKNDNYARVARETIEYVLRDMTDPEGGFYSTEDADSEGHEGKFYVWSLNEVVSVLGPERAEIFNYVYDVTDAGNFEGQNILNLPKSIEQCAQLKRLDAAQLTEQLAADRDKLFTVREKRVRPGRDDKVLVAWNGLMIDAMAYASGALAEPRYAEAAQQAADFVLAKISRTDGRLLHTWRAGQAKVEAYLDDYACLINALVSVYEAGFDERYIDAAVELADQMIAHFADATGGGFFYTPDDGEQLISRQKDLQDSATPSGNSMAATALVRLGKLTGRTDYLEAAVGCMRAAAGLMQRYPTAAGQMLIALDWHLGPTHEIAILGGAFDVDTMDAVARLRERFIPNKLIAFRSEPTRPATTETATSNEAQRAIRSAALDPLFSGKKALQPPPTVYLCENFACQAPGTGVAEAISVWDRLSSPKP